MIFKSKPTKRHAAQVICYGAYHHTIDGRHILRCPLLFVQRGNKQKTIKLHGTDGATFKVALPEEAVKNTEHLRFSFEELAILATGGKDEQ